MPREREHIQRWRAHDYYAVLGVAPECAAVDIRQGFRRVALACHPDKVPPEERERATRKFQLIAEAYEVLSKGEVRQQYDEVRRKGQTSRAKKQTSAAKSSANPNAWTWPAWCLDRKSSNIEFLVIDDDAMPVWVQGQPCQRITDPETRQDTHLNANYRWDGEEYNEDFGPDRVRRRGQLLTVADELRIRTGVPEQQKAEQTSAPTGNQAKAAPTGNQATSAPTRNQAEEVLDKLGVLMAMGFEESQAKDALARCSSVEAAVEYIMLRGATVAPRSVMEYIASAATKMQEAVQPAARQLFTPDANSDGKVQSLVSTLMELGYTQQQASAAAGRCSSVEASVEWIASHPEI